MKFRSLLRADYNAQCIIDVPWDQLHAAGIRGLLFDVDNTITAWHSMEVSREVRDLFLRLKEQGWLICLVSNSYALRVRPIGEMLGVPSIHMAGKPRSRSFHTACNWLKLHPHQVAMVGDQLLTDMLGANRIGLTTVLVNKVDRKESWFTANINRRIEGFLKRRANKS